MEEIVIENWSDIADLEIEYAMEYFRGQSDASWPLTSSLQRCLRGTSEAFDPSNMEYWLLRRFKRGAGRYLNTLPDEKDLVSWLSLMQHHGAPTRLIDFTQSFYVACYFALSGAKSDSAIWAIHPSLLFEAYEELSAKDRVGLRDEWDDRSTEFGNHFLCSLLKNANTASEPVSSKGAIAVEPFRLDNRLSIQQGLFLMPIDLQMDLLENLAPYLSKSRYQIKKIILKKEMAETGLAHLSAMNITAETLFPGLDGFARSLVHRELWKN